jgi:hypothetical protein
MKTTYRNKFHIPGSRHSEEILSTDAKPVKYKGYLIYERVKGSIWDVVKDGVCVGMYAGPNGAKNFINEQWCIENGFLYPKKLITVRYIAGVETFFHSNKGWEYRADVIIDPYFEELARKALLNGISRTRNQS